MHRHQVIAMVHTAIVLVAILVSPPVVADSEGNAVLSLPILTSRIALDDDLWEEVQHQRLLGIAVDFGRERWPIHMAIGLNAAMQEGHIDMGGCCGCCAYEVQAFLSDASLGVQRGWSFGRVPLHVGGGLVFVKARRTFDFDRTRPRSETEKSYGYYLQTGLYYRARSRAVLGISLRWVLGTDIEFTYPEDEEGDTNHVQGGFVIGWGWPPR